MHGFPALRLHGDLTDSMRPDIEIGVRREVNHKRLFRITRSKPS